MKTCWQSNVIILNVKKEYEENSYAFLIHKNELHFIKRENKCYQTPISYFLSYASRIIFLLTE